MTRDREARMCRWLAYSGTPVLLDQLLNQGQYSLLYQSLHSRMGAEETNGDGFGVGWYGEGDRPGVYRSVDPAWNDWNLKNMAAHIRSGLVLAHIRASSGTPVQQTNCHPFCHGRWLFMHNGVVHDFAKVKRDLVLQIDPSLYPSLLGSADSEVLFFLALTYGLEDDPPAAIARTIGLVEHVGREHGVEFPFQGTIATSNGERLWAFRYSSEGKSRTLYYSSKLETIRELYPEMAVLHGLGEESRLVVSEPLGEFPGVWNEVPESSWGVIQPGQDEIHPFTPVAPGALVSA
jgi:predicted glutamine amidotransferase